MAIEICIAQFFGGLKMTLLTMTFCIMTILITINTGDINYNEITYNRFILQITLLLTVNKNICVKLNLLIL